MPILTTLEISLAVVALEFGVLALALGLVMRKRSVRSVASVQKDAEAALVLAESVVEKEPSRREALELIFRKKYNLGEDAISGRVDEFVERERAFYQTLIATFAKRDGEALVDIGDQLNNVIAPWISLVPEGMVSEEDLTDLNQANETLNAELERNKNVLEELMTEYDRAFHKEKTIAQEDAKQSVAAETDLFEDEDGELHVEAGPSDMEDGGDDSGETTSRGAAAADDMDLELSPDPGGASLADNGDDQLAIDSGLPAEQETGSPEPEIELDKANASTDDGGIMPLNAGEIDNLLESLDSEPA